MDKMQSLRELLGPVAGRWTQTNNNSVRRCHRNLGECSSTAGTREGLTEEVTRELA